MNLKNKFKACPSHTTNNVEHTLNALVFLFFLVGLNRFRVAFVTKLRRTLACFVDCEDEGHTPKRHAPQSRDFPFFGDATVTPLAVNSDGQFRKKSRNTRKRN